MDEGVGARPMGVTALLRLSLLGGLITGALHLVLQVWIVYDLILQAPFLSSMQYIVSAVVGTSAFEGGLPVALIGFVGEFVLTTIIASIFVVIADRIALVRSRIIASSLVYGFVVFIVMTFVVVPLSAAPPLPPPALWLLIEIILEHILLIGLPLGILVKAKLADTGQLAR